MMSPSASRDRRRSARSRGGRRAARYGPSGAPSATVDRGCRLHRAPGQDSRCTPIDFAPMDSAAIRRSFVEHFVERGHIEVPSASLVPATLDPSVVLLTTAGMQPFKPFPAAMRPRRRPPCLVGAVRGVIDGRSGRREGLRDVAGVVVELYRGSEMELVLAGANILELDVLAVGRCGAAGVDLADLHEVVARRRRGGEARRGRRRQGRAPGCFASTRLGYLHEARGVQSAGPPLSSCPNGLEAPDLRQGRADRRRRARSPCRR